MNFKKLLPLLLLLLMGIKTTAQTTNTKKLDSLFDALTANNQALGSVAISQNGKLLYTRTTGISLNKLVAVQSKDVIRYRIGSISKMFTACMIFQLIEDHKLMLSTTLSSYFPQVPNANRITIGQMLGHRSGLHNFTDDERYPVISKSAKTQQEMLTLISAQTPSFPPDSMAAYSNTNYVLLGYILESIYKKPYKDILKEKIVQRAGLKHTFFAETPDHKEALSYTYEDTWKEVAPTHMSIPGGAGAVISTPTDLNLFIDALFAGKLVSKASLDQMKSIRDGFGMGMFTFPFDNQTFYGHNGGIDGFTSITGHNLADGLTVAYCSNGNRFAMNNILIGILAICYNKPYVIPDFKTVEVSDKDLDQYLGTYTSGELPLAIAITKNGSTLMAQATGQGAFPLEATAKDKFKFDAAGIVLEFNPVAHEMTLKQGGGIYLFKLKNQ